MEEKIKALFSDKAFVEKLVQLETPEEVKACLAENGVEVSAEEIRQVKELLEKRSNGEITDEELEKVSGGSLTCLLCFGIGAAIGTGVFFGLKGIFTRRW